MRFLKKSKQMKNLSLLFISIVTLALFSCQREEVQQNGGLVTITATQKSSPDLKTNIGAPGTVAVTWNETDNLAVFDATELNQNVPFTYSTGADTKSATFSGVIQEWANGQKKTFNAFYPYNIANDEQSYLAFGFYIPTSQTQIFIGGLPDYDHLGLYDFMAASPVEVTRTGAEQPAISFEFKHLMAILDIEVTNSTGGAVTVTKISVQRAADDITGRAQVDFSKSPGQAGFYSVPAGFPYNHSDLTLQNSGSTGVGGTITGSMIIAPVDLSGGITGFVVTVTGGTQYAVAKTAGPSLAAGNRYKAQITITTPSFFDLRSSKVYKTVKIGTQIWMAENLNFVPASGSSWCYDNNSLNCDTYGRLYDWTTATADNHGNGTDICPAGWHLPTDGEFTTLTTFLGGLGVAGGPLKETGTTHWTSQSAGATNSSGFTALPGGRSYNGAFDYLGLRAYFWSASENGTLYAWGRYLNYNYDGVYRLDYYRTVGFSVRCLQNN
jgi:uncharacterized protein (TIGR02145 family)